ncbi:hypothetical protein V3F56_03110 [Moorellaceae bacterium AZ2]
MLKLTQMVRDVITEIDTLALETVEEGLRPQQVARRLRSIWKYYLGQLSEISKQRPPAPEVAVVQRFVDELAALAQTIEQEKTPEDVIQEYLGYWSNKLEIKWGKLRRKKTARH